MIESILLGFAPLTLLIVTGLALDLRFKNKMQYVEKVMSVQQPRKAITTQVVR